MDADAATDFYPVAHADTRGVVHALCYIHGCGYFYIARDGDDALSVVDAESAYPNVTTYRSPPPPQPDADARADSGPADAGTGRDGDAAG